MPRQRTSLAVEEARARGRRSACISRRSHEWSQCCRIRPPEEDRRAVEVALEHAVAKVGQRGAVAGEVWAGSVSVVSIDGNRGAVNQAGRVAAERKPMTETMSSGLGHFEKSAFGIALRFCSVSILSRMAFAQTPVPRVAAESR